MAPVIAASAYFYPRLMAGALEGKPPTDVADLTKWFGVMAMGGTVTVVLSVVQIGAISHATVRHLDGERAPFGRMLAVGLRRALPLVATTIVLWIVAMAGFLLLIVPGVMFVVAACVAIPAAVLERPGIVGALRRSFELTRGFRWPLFAAWLVVTAVLYVISLVVQTAFTLLALGGGVEKLLTYGLVGSQIGNAFFAAIPWVAIAVCYHDLRETKEGPNTARLARVFE
jgi:hypothetical protein